MKKKKEDSNLLRAKVKWDNFRWKIGKFFDQHFDPIVFFIIMFMAASIYIMASAGIKEYKAKYVCTQSIETICTDVSSRYDDEDNVMKYYPTFSATHHGKTYHYEFKFPTLEEPQVGDRAYFYINPKDPTEYVDSTDMTEYGETGAILFGFCIFGLWLNRWITKKGKNHDRK